MGATNTFDPDLDARLRMLIASAKDDYALALAFHHINRHFRERVTDAFLVHLLSEVKDWRAFISSVNECILKANDDGSTLLAYLENRLLPLVQDHPLLLRLREDLKQGLLVGSTRPNLPRIAFNVCCTDVDSMRRLLRVSERKVTSHAIVDNARKMPETTLAGLILYVRKDLTDERVLDPIEEYAFMRDCADLKAAVSDARARLALASSPVRQQA